MGRRWTKPLWADEILVGLWGKGEGREIHGCNFADRQAVQAEHYRGGQAQKSDAQYREKISNYVGQKTASRVSIHSNCIVASYRNPAQVQRS